MSQLVGRMGNVLRGDRGLDSRVQFVSAVSGLNPAPSAGLMAVVSPASGLDIAQIYDAAKGKWVSQDVLVGSTPTAFGVPNLALSSVEGQVGSILDYKALYDAGLRPEFKFSHVSWSSAGGTVTMTVRVGVMAVVDGDTADSSLSAAALVANGYVEQVVSVLTGTPGKAYHQGWTALTSPVAPASGKPHAAITIVAASNPSASGLQLSRIKIWQRWTS